MKSSGVFNRKETNEVDAYEIEMQDSKSPIHDGPVVEAHDPHEEPLEQGRTASVKGLISDAASNTGTHGIPNIMRTKSIARRVFWTIIVLGGLAIMCWQVTTAVIKYFGYPTTTSIVYSHETNLQFPAITVCNLNPAMMYKLDQYSGTINLSEYLHDVWGGWEEAWGENVTSPTEFDTWYEDEDNVADDSYEYDFTDYDDDYEVYQGTEDASFDYLDDFLTVMSTLSDSDKRSMGHELEEMFIGCTWQGKECNANQFYQFYNYMYGNCFTFNSGRSGSVLKTSKEGPLHSFQLELYINSDEYIPGIADGAGVRVVIHDQSVMPLPEEDGFNVRPGTKTSVEMRKRTINRSTPPHGDCKNYTKAEVKALNAYVTEYDGVGYSTKSCMKTCLQQATLDSCGCYDYKVPYDKRAKAYDGIPSSSFREVCTNDTDVTSRRTDCLAEVNTKFVESKLGCTKLCKDPCVENDFPYVISSASWPSGNSQDRVLSLAAQRSQALWDIITTDDWGHAERRAWVEDNLVKVEVYFKHFNHELVLTEPTYDPLSLISDFGGQCGLWLGLSIIALFELFELAMDLIVIITKKCKERRIKKAQKERTWADEVETTHKHTEPTHTQL